VGRQQRDGRQRGAGGQAGPTALRGSPASPSNSSTSLVDLPPAFRVACSIRWPLGACGCACALGSGSSVAAAAAAAVAWPAPPEEPEVRSEAEEPAGSALPSSVLLRSGSEPHALLALAAPPPLLPPAVGWGGVGWGGVGWGGVGWGGAGA
jgi:hypothetical protein